ncbi:DegT/DnrJ/EryC1/StrS family aminotransferase [Sphingomonas edaphi]|uniref:DegT/DnrJ/EryC1/StrS aminotransferase family protein n=1 Tax=Sphingomonas edaphi TaxID=2315689 RepID=A0A418PXS2_9SPHN|nr:DegT/DnrJ/EryC1/StrS aminotransferase family protein [Sphingomonas edaphi]RIX27010.1 DegT/DnrJ/EryC1/StrS aminotransferase family protein [Sphingomonas edaphi]
MLNSSFASWPCFSQEEADAVRDVLLSNRVNYWTGGEGRHFESEFAAWSGARHAIALANGTVALDLALRGLGIGSANGGSADDEVVVTPRTFLASVSTVVNAGAIPVFADVDRDSGNLNAKTIAKVISPRTRAVVVVHLAGWPADLDPIIALAADHDFFVIEDCAQAHGARYKGKSVGSIGHVGAWSFCQDKIMTTGGEGGMVTCSDRDLWSRMWSFKDHGKSWEAVYERQHPPGFRWLHESFGTNWRMLEMQAAIGRIQLKRMADWTAMRNHNASQMLEALAPAEERGAIRLPQVDNHGGQTVHANYKFYGYINPDRLRAGWSRDRIVQEINDRGVPCFHGSCSEVYLEKAFEGTGWRPEPRLPIARELGETSLMWLVHPTLQPSEIQKAGEVSAEVLALATAD